MGQRDGRYAQIESPKPQSQIVEALELFFGKVVELNYSQSAKVQQVPFQKTVGFDMTTRVASAGDMSQPSPGLLFVANDRGGDFVERKLVQSGLDSVAFGAPPL